METALELIDAHRLQAIAYYTTTIHNVKNIDARRCCQVFSRLQGLK
jgi:hypothetical protein